MFARVTTHEGGDNEKIREFAEKQKAQPNMGLPSGVRRALILGGSERRLFITFFDSREAIAAAEPAFEKLGEQIPDQQRGNRASVEIFEVLTDESM